MPGQGEEWEAAASITMSRAKSGHLQHLQQHPPHNYFRCHLDFTNISYLVEVCTMSLPGSWVNWVTNKQMFRDGAPQNIHLPKMENQSYGDKQEARGNLGLILLPFFLSWPFSVYSGWFSASPQHTLFPLFSSASLGCMAIPHSDFHSCRFSREASLSHSLIHIALILKTYCTSCPFQTSLPDSAAFMISLSS